MAGRLIVFILSPAKRKLSLKNTARRQTPSERTEILNHLMMHLVHRNHKVPSRSATMGLSMFRQSSSSRRHRSSFLLVTLTSTLSGAILLTTPAGRWSPRWLMYGSMHILRADIQVRTRESLRLIGRQWTASKAVRRKESKRLTS